MSPTTHSAKAISGERRLTSLLGDRRAGSSRRLVVASDDKDRKTNARKTKAHKLKPRKAKPRKAKAHKLKAHKAKPRKAKAHKTVRVNRLWMRLIERFDDSVQVSGAFVLISIAILTLISIPVSLFTPLHNFPATAISAVGYVLLVIMIVEITGNIVNRTRIHNFLIVVIASLLREILWLCAQLSFAGTGAGAGETMHMVIELGIMTVVMMGMVASLALLRRTSDDNAS